MIASNVDGLAPAAALANRIPLRTGLFAPSALCPAYLPVSALCVTL